MIHRAADATHRDAARVPIDLRVYSERSSSYCSRRYGATENARPENAGLENDGQNSRSVLR